MPYKVFVAGEEALAADANTYLMSQTVARFTNATQRTSQLTAPVANQLSMLDTRNGLQYWNGSAWVDLATGESSSGAAKRVYARKGSTSTNASGDISLAWGAGLFSGVPDAVLLTNGSPGIGLVFAINHNTLTNTGVDFRVFNGTVAFASSAVVFFYAVIGLAA